MNPFIESGMTFGPFPDDDIFRIEESKLLKQCTGSKTVEFIWKKRDTLMMFVEAKSSSPINRAGNEDNYRRFIDEIKHKFVDSFNFLMAGLYERRSGHEEIPVGIKTVDYKKVHFRFVLIIKGHKSTWLSPLKRELETVLKEHRNIWNSEVIVLNDITAREEKFIT